MDILLYPDPRLRLPCEPVEDFDEGLVASAREMFALMYRTKGVGLAAPQVGIARRFLVYNPEGDPERPECEMVLVNPRVAYKAREAELGEEGCLSFPGLFGSVERSVAARVEARDLKGRPIALDLDGWAARVFLHEFDHLDGILFIDRMTPADKSRVRSRLKEMEQRFKEAGAHTPRA